MAAAIETNVSGPKLSSRADLRYKKGKFACVKNVTKSACSTNKLNHAKKMAKKRCIEDDAEAHEEGFGYHGNRYDVIKCLERNLDIPIISHSKIYFSN